MSVSLIARVLFIYFFPAFYPFSRVSCVRVHRDRRVSRRRPRRQRSIFVPCPIAGRGRSPRPALTPSDYRQRPYVTAAATTAARKDKVGDFFFVISAAMTTACTTSAAGLIRTYPCRNDITASRCALVHRYLGMIRHRNNIIYLGVRYCGLCARGSHGSFTNIDR